MSQQEVYQIIKELGGSARLKEIENVAKTKFPDLDLYTYVLDRLKKLQKKEMVYFDQKSEKWKIGRV